MILSCSNICKSFGENDILKQVSFHIEDHEKAAIVGINGAGKSTLLKVLIGKLNADDGVVTWAKGASIGYLAQHQDLEGAETIYDALLEVKKPVIQMEARIRSLELEMKSASGDELETKLSEYSRLNHEFEMADGYSYQSEITGVLKGLGFTEDEFSKPITALSGGQKTRVSLGKLLLTKPDILLLDEPTNHLDMESIAWLETYLRNYSGAVIIVAHDRYFLDRVVTKIIELDMGHCTVFSGNYSAYSDKKAMLRDAAIRAYLNQQQEIRHQEAVIAKLKSFNREKSIKRAESREKMLDKIERLEKPTQANDSMDIRLEPDVVSGNDVLTVTDLSKSFDTQTLFTNVDFEIKRGERVAIIGNNGTGKTTLSTDPKRLLIGDDEHGWDDNGVFNFEGGCYAKVINLDKDSEPDIYNAIKRNALLENVTLDAEGKIDFADKSVTENTRVSYPIDHIKNIVRPISAAPAAKNVIFLSADAFGVLPPVSILTPEQTQYYFLSGFTAKLAGTERGITEPTPTFSACFGQAFLELHPTKYAEELVKKMEKSGAKAYLVNTGWNGTGKRISIKDTRGIIDAILNGSINNAPTKQLPYFNFEIPTELPGVDTGILDPRDTYADAVEWETKAKDLAQRFTKNFAKYEGNAAGKALVAAGPQI